MVAVNVRYVVERLNSNGSVRRYWVRPGYDTERLPDTGWAERAEHLNNHADAGKHPRRKVRGKMPVGIGTVGHWCELYENTTDASVGVAQPFQSLAANTRKNYLRQLGFIKSKLGNIPLEGITRKVLVMLLLYTGQRIGDVLAMTWADYDGEYIKVVQQKTKAKADVYCHHVLKAELETWRGSQKIFGATILTRYDGKPLSYNRVRNRTTEILTAIDRRHLQLRDLRRTAATKLAEAGCTTPQIASITGHSIDRCQRILDTYVVKTRATAKAAIEKLERFDRSRTQADC